MVETSIKVTIHKAQGFTLDIVVIEVGKKKLACGLTFVACSRVHELTDLHFNPPFTFHRIANLANLAKCQRLQKRLLGFVLWRQLLYQLQ